MMKLKHFGFVLALLVAATTSCQSAPNEKDSTTDEPAKASAQGEENEAQQGTGQDQTESAKAEEKRALRGFRLEVTSRQIRLEGDAVCQIDRGAVPPNLTKGGETGLDRKSVV